MDHLPSLPLLPPFLRSILSPTKVSGMSPPHSQALLRPQECGGGRIQWKEKGEKRGGVLRLVPPPPPPPPRPGHRLHSSQREKEQSGGGGEHVVSLPGPMLRVTNCRNERNEMMESRWCWSLFVSLCYGGSQLHAARQKPETVTELWREGRNRWFWRGDVLFLLASEHKPCEI